ncbi:MAG: thrombospondin type 3 repeat-containing protein [Dehalococcoidia bacterium]
MRPFRRLTLLRLLPLAALFALAAFLGADVSTHDASAASGVHGSGSCNPGFDACEFNTGTIGANSCTGDLACYGNKGTIGNNSCNGNYACYFNSGTIGNGSCTGFAACEYNGHFGTGTIGSNSCIGETACHQNGQQGNGTVGDGSCIGTNACAFNGKLGVGTVGDYSCNGDDQCPQSTTASPPGVGDCTENLSGSVPAECEDPDSDTIVTLLDNCPLVLNSDQLNTDGDTEGDACDSDDDNDGVPDGVDGCPTNPSVSMPDTIGAPCDPDEDNDTVLDPLDNCPLVPNSDQLNRDNDSEGDACDADDDNDGVSDGGDSCPLELPGANTVDPANGCLDFDLDTVFYASDNCPVVANSDQLDNEGDAAGDACDPDDDNDGLPDSGDGCPLELPGANAVDPANGCLDFDLDTVLYAFDNCPVVANHGQEDNDGDGDGDACDPDDDNDTVADTTDNCPVVANTAQTNNDTDAQGDACDSDDDNDTIPDTTDNCPVVPNPTQTDADGDSVGDACDTGDTTKPVVTVSVIDGATGRPDVPGAPTRGPVRVFFTCADEAGGSGIPPNSAHNDTSPSVKGNTYPPSLELARTQSLDLDPRWTCIDAAGNVADPPLGFPLSVLIDRIAPRCTVVLSLTRIKRDGTPTPVTATVTASDQGGAGVAPGELKIVSISPAPEAGGPALPDVSPGTWTLKGAIGKTFTFTGRAVDRAGNVSAPCTARVTSSLR